MNMMRRDEVSFLFVPIACSRFAAVGELCFDTVESHFVSYLYTESGYLARVDFKCVSSR